MHALKSNTQFSLKFSTLHIMSHGSCHNCVGMTLSRSVDQWESLYFYVLANTSGNMDLAALKVESDASLACPVEHGDCLMRGRRKWKMSSCSFHCQGTERKEKKGLLKRTRISKRDPSATWDNKWTTHQVDIEHRSVITIHVHIHGALLWSEADSAVLQGERGAGCNIISESGQNINMSTCRQPREFTVWD